MKRRSQILFYIFINILISALTTLSVLWLWERSHPIPENPQPTPVTIIPAPTEEQAPTELTTTAIDVVLVEENLDIQIRSVVGAGNIEMEYVELYNQSDGAIDMSGWQLVNAEQDTFLFPMLILNQGGAIKVYSKSGQNTVIELYWQSDLPIWQSGTTVRLLDSDDVTITTYSIP